MQHSPRRTTISVATPAAAWLVLSLLGAMGCDHGAAPGAEHVGESLVPSTGPAAAPFAKSALPGSDGVSFVDVAQERGLNFIWPVQPRPMRILEAFGSGCAAFDADNDGWQDILLVGDPHPALFRNRGGAAFENVTLQSGLSAVEGDWTGCAIGDYDGDGLLDVLLTGFHRLALYRNAGGLRFEPATDTAGLDAENHGHWGASAGFMDLDGDSWLDLVILNYVVFG